MNARLMTRQPQDWDGEVIVSNADSERFVAANDMNNYYFEPTDDDTNAFVCEAGAWHWDTMSCNCSSKTEI